MNADVHEGDVRAPQRGGQFGARLQTPPAWIQVLQRVK